MSEQRQWRVDHDPDGWRVFDLVTGTGLGPLSNEAGAQNLRAFCQRRTDFESELEAEIERLKAKVRLAYSLLGRALDGLTTTPN